MKEVVGDVGEAGGESALEQEDGGVGEVAEIKVGGGTGVEAAIEGRGYAGHVPGGGGIEEVLAAKDEVTGFT